MSASASLNRNRFPRRRFLQSAFAATLAPSIVVSGADADIFDLAFHPDKLKLRIERAIGFAQKNPLIGIAAAHNAHVAKKHGNLIRTLAKRRWRQGGPIPLQVGAAAYDDPLAQQTHKTAHEEGFGVFSYGFFSEIETILGGDSEIGGAFSADGKNHCGYICNGVTVGLEIGADMNLATGYWRQAEPKAIAGNSSSVSFGGYLGAGVGLNFVFGTEDDAPLLGFQIIQGAGLAGKAVAAGWSTTVCW